MSDDFDKLPPINEDDEDDLPDWQRDKPQKSGGASSGDSLGFTGELTWRKELEDDFDELVGGDDADDFDWQADQPASGSPGAPGGFGFTRELDWKQGGLGGTEEPAADEPPDWLSGLAGAPPPPEDEDDPFVLPPEDEEETMRDEVDDPLSWLQEFSAPDEESPAPVEPPSQQAEMPSWLDDADDFADEPADEPAPDADVPDWLQAFDDAPKSMTEGGKLSDEWLAGAEAAPDSAQTEMTFDQWQQMQADLTRPRDIEEEMPDLFSELGGEGVVPDDLPQSDTGALPSWVLGMEDLDDSQAPDWFVDEPDPAAATAPSATTEQMPEDIFAELGLPPSGATGYDFLDMPEEEDLLAGLNLGEQPDESPDWFAQMDAPAEPDVPDWLQAIGSQAQDAEAPTMDMSAGADFPEEDLFPAEDDFLSELRGLSDFNEPAREIDPLDTSGLQDIDSLLASYDSVLPTGDFSASSTDMDQLLSGDELRALDARRAPAASPGGIEGLSPDAPDWLTELGANVDEVSAAAIVRKQSQRERSLDELSDRLQALHERGLEIPTSDDAAAGDVIKTLLPGVDEVLPSAPITTTQPERVGDLVLTEVQRNKMNLLRTMVGSEAEQRRAARPSAIDLTLDTPNLSDLGIDEPDMGLDGPLTDDQPLPVSRIRARRRLPKLDRLAISLLLLAAVGLPFFFPPARIGDLPPVQFPAGSPAQSVYNQVDALRADDLALIAVEYGPTGAAELDPALDAVLRHLLSRGARPVIASGNAVGLLHAGNVLEGIVNDRVFLSQNDQTSFQANRDYFVLRYLPAGVVGLRAFSEDLPNVVANDVNGSPTGLDAQSVRDFPLIVVISESADELRGWAEQVAPLAGKPLVGIVSQSAAPLSLPYVLPQSPSGLSGLSGLLVGYRDAYTYRSMVDSGFEGVPLPTIETPPPTQTVVPVIETTPEATAEAETEATADVEVTGTTEAEAEATATTAPSNTPVPTNTTDPTATLTPTPTNTPTRTPDPGVTIRAVVNSAQAVNVREGPGRSFAPVTALSPGSIVTVIGRSGDGTWIQVRLEDDTEGWISADLLAIEEPEAAADEAITPTAESLRHTDGIMLVGLMSDVSFLPAFQDESTPEATAEVTEAASVETTAEATAEATVEPAPAETTITTSLQSVTANRDERWYGMTLGLVAIILILTIGMIVNILRGLFRRNQS